MSELNMYWISTLIINKLSDICSMLSLNHEDKKLYEICIRDFQNYMKYLEINYQTKNDGENYSEDIFYDIIINQLHQDLENTKEVIEFVECWTVMWWKKWQERTKIVFSDKDLPKNVIRPENGVPPSTLTPEEREELLGVTIKKLIQYGEICCTQILGEKLPQKAVEDMRGKELGDKLALISKLQRQAKEISYVHGPLVFIKPDENYFKLREWRDDNFAGNKII